MAPASARPSSDWPASTMISWSYYGERCWTHLFGKKSSIYFQLLFIGFVFLGSIVGENKILVFTSSWPKSVNAVCLNTLLKNRVTSALLEYVLQKITHKKTRTDGRTDIKI